MRDDPTHTPGPWHVESGCIVGSGVNIGGADRDDSRTSPCERDRNVDLMAAAPLMLQLLRYTIANTRISGLPVWLRDEIKAVIKTAEGKDRP